MIEVPGTGPGDRANDIEDAPRLITEGRWQDDLGSSAIRWAHIVIEGFSCGHITRRARARLHRVDPDAFQPPSCARPSYDAVHAHRPLLGRQDLHEHMSLVRGSLRIAEHAQRDKGCI